MGKQVTLMWNLPLRAFGRTPVGGLPWAPVLVILLIFSLGCDEQSGGDSKENPQNRRSGGVSHFRGDSGRSGHCEAPGLRNLTGAKWKFVVPGVLFSSPVVADAVVYIGDCEGGTAAVHTRADFNLYALECDSGSVRWKFPILGLVGTPTVAQGLVYVPDAGLRALDAQTGKQVWEFLSVGAPIYSSPVVEDSRVFFNTRDGDVYALNAYTGKEVWHVKVGTSFGFSSAALAEGILFLANDDHHLYALDSQSGQMLWKFKTGNGIRSTPSARSGSVYAASDDHFFYALDGKSGRLKWKVDVGGVAGPAAVSDHMAIICTHQESLQSSLIAMDIDSGKEHWRFEVRGSFDSAASIAQGMVYFGSADGHLYVLDLPTGKLRWSFNAGPGIDGSPMVYRDSVYFSSRYARTLYALQ